MFGKRSDFELDSLSETTPPIIRYSLALALTFVAVGLRGLLLPISAGVKFTTFYPIVILTFYLAGNGPGIMCIILTAIAAFYFFMTPYRTWDVTSESLIQITLYLIASGSCGYVVSRMNGYRKRLLESEKESKRQAEINYSLAINGGQLAVWKLEPGGLVSFSDRFASIFGLPVGVNTVAYSKLLSIVHPDDRKLVEEVISKAAVSNADFVFEHRLSWPDGTEHSVHTHGAPIFSDDGQIKQIDGVTLDITDRVALQRQLEKKVMERTVELEAANRALSNASRHDALTGLNNRMACDERLQAEFERMKRTKEIYSILMLDIDFFKDVNDSCGHAVGDSVLKLIAQTLSRNLREYDFIARWGGEEFLVLLPATEFDEACVVAEKLRSAVETSSHPLAGTVTISIGVAIASPDDVDAEISVLKADESLYEAKRSGRNRVVAKIPPPATQSSNQTQQRFRHWGR